MNMNFYFETKLLRRCAANEADAQRVFAQLSYLNQIYKTASQTNAQYNNALDESELEELCKVWTREVYKGHGTLPSMSHPLYRRIETYVFGAFWEYLNGEAPKK
jgi:hypothetical protein